MDRNRKILDIPAFILIYFFLLTGCDGTSPFSTTRGHSTSTIAMEASPYFIANSTDNSPLWDSFEGITVEDLTNKAKASDGESTFLLGLIQFGHITGFEREPDTSEGIRLLQEAWRLGVIDAGHSLFTVYYKGIGTRINKPLALAYLQASAEKGYILSQKRLGFAYRGSDPRGLVEKDIQQARIWFTRAAEQGDAESASQLAAIYRKGLGVPKDERTAFEWLKRAENMPFDGSISHGGLAVYYEEGIGTEVDLVQAYKYFDLQGTAGVPDKKRLEAQMTPEQVQQAIALSRAWQEENRTFFPSYYGLEHQSDGSYR